MRNIQRMSNEYRTLTVICIKTDCLELLRMLSFVLASTVETRLPGNVCCY